MEPGRRRDHSGCVEGDGGVGGEGGEGPGIIAAMQTEKQKKCGGVKGLLSRQSILLYSKSSIPI